MKAARQYVIVLVTAPALQSARRIVAQALQARLVACGNLIPKLESHYWWQHRIERSSEVLIVFKTTTAKVPALEKLVLAIHPYDTPEIISLRLSQGTPRYLRWIQDNVGLERVAARSKRTH